MVYGPTPAGVRRMWSLVTGLHPHESAYARSHGTASLWTQPVEMQASTLDLLQMILRVLQVAHLQDPPTGAIRPIPRPWQDTPPDPTPTVSLAQFRQAMRGD